MFDMNLFFQHLVARLLKENLPGFEVKEERTLRSMMQLRRFYEVVALMDAIRSGRARERELAVKLLRNRLS